MSGQMLNQRTNHQKPKEFGGTVSVQFDNIEDYLIACIRNSTEVVGCVAWLRSPKILKALEHKKCNIAITSDTKLPRYSKIQPFMTTYGTAVRKVGLARGRYRALMHNKFLVFLLNGKPRFVVTGSFNLTKHSTHNLENIVTIKIPECAEHYLKEAVEILNISRPV